MTADELLHLPNDARCELVRGTLRKREFRGARHGEVASALNASLHAFVREHRLGKVYAAETGFRIARDPDSVRAPDSAFVRAERVVRTKKYFEGAPDAAFEVVSPNDSYTEVESKTQEWLRAGVRAVVIVDPETEIVRIHRPDGVVIAGDVLVIEDIIPGWTLPLADLFEQ